MIANVINEIDPAIGKNTENERKHLLYELEKEIVQVAAVCVAWLECFVRKRKDEI